jgi:hypothetical protein
MPRSTQVVLRSSLITPATPQFNGPDFPSSCLQGTVCSHWLTPEPITVKEKGLKPDWLGPMLWCPQSVCPMGRVRPSENQVVFEI